jgi:hypothetical protein
MLTFVGFIPDIYIPFLRNNYASRFPEEWEKESNNGSYSTLIVTGQGSGGYAHDEVCVAGKITEFKKNGKPYDLYPKETKYNKFWLQDVLSYTLLYIIHLITNNIIKTWIFSKIIFSFLWLILIYILCRQFKLTSLYSIFCSVSSFYFGAVLEQIYFIFPNFYIIMVKNISVFFLIDFSNPVSVYTRLVNPLISYSFMFLSLIILYKYYIPEDINKEIKINNIKNIIYGIFLGLLIFIHPFEWSFSLSITFLIMILLRIYKLNKISLNLFLIITISIIISLPYIIMQITSKSTIEGYHIFKTRIPDFRSIIYIIFAFIIWYLFYKKKFLSLREYLFFISINIVSFGIANHQVLIGENFSVEHYYAISGFFITIMLLVIFGKYLEKKLSLNYFNIFSAMLIFLSLSLVINKGLIFSQNNYKTYGLPKSYEKVFEWLKVNTPKNSVIGTNNMELILLLPVYTDNIPYTGFVASPLTQMSYKENIYRYKELIEILKLDKDKLSDTYKIWDEKYHRKYASKYLHEFLILKKADRESYEINYFAYTIVGPQSILELNPTKRENLLKEINQEIFFKDLQHENIPQYELSYLIVEPWTKKFITKELDYPLLYDQDGIQIYKFEKDSLNSN